MTRGYWSPSSKTPPPDAAGCSSAWREYANLLTRRTRWEEPVLIRFIRLLGKRLVEAVFDPEINLIFLAWDTIVPNYAREEWESYSEERSILDPAYTHRLKWKEIAPRPQDVSEAWGVLYAIFEGHVTRLEEVLAQNEASEAMLKQDPTWMDRAVMDYSPKFERLRRYQSARTRELHKTLELLNKMRGAGGVERGAEDVGREAAGVEREAWSVEREEDCVEREEAVEVVPEGGETPEKSPNEANLVSTQGTEGQEVETETQGLAKRERSQSGAGERAGRDAGTRSRRPGCSEMRLCRERMVRVRSNGGLAIIRGCWILLGPGASECLVRGAWARDRGLELRCRPRRREEPYSGWFDARPDAGAGTWRQYLSPESSRTGGPWCRGRSWEGRKDPPRPSRGG